MDFDHGDLQAVGIALGDLNGDGRLDVVVPHQQAQDVAVMLGNGDGT